MEDVVAPARRIEKILNEQTDTKMERLVKEANEQIAAHRTAAPPVAAMAIVPAPTTATAAASQPPPATPACHIYQDYSEEPPFYRPPRHQMDRRPPRCFLCGEEGHFVSNCPACPVLQRLLRQQTLASARAPPRGQILELPATDDDSHPNSNVHLNC